MPAVSLTTLDLMDHPQGLAELLFLLPVLLIPPFSLRRGVRMQVFLFHHLGFRQKEGSDLSWP